MDEKGAQPARDMRSHEARPLTENEKKRLGWVCQRLNVDIDFDYQGVGDGVYLPAENGRRARISLNAAPLEPYKFVFKHELAHHLQTAKGYEQTRKALLGSPVFTDWLTDKYGGSVVRVRAAVIERYKQQGVTLDLTEATDELVADFFADCAFDGLDGEIDNQFLDRLATDEPSVFKRLWNAVKDLVERLRGMFYFKDMSEVERRFETLARQVQTGQTENTAQNGGARYSFSNSKSGMANDALSSYSDELTRLIEQKGDYIVDSFEKLEQIVNLAFDNPQVKATAYFGIINPEMLAKIKNSVPNLPKANETTLFKEGRDYSVAVTLDTIRHIVDDKKLARTDVVDYLDRLADTILDFDSVHFDYYTDSRNQRIAGLLFKKSFSDGTLISFNLVSHKKRSMMLQTLYMNSMDYQKKKAAETPLMQNAPAHTLEARVGQPYGNSIPQNAAAVNNHSMQGNEKYSIPSDEGAAEDRQSAAQQTAADIVDAFNKGDIDSEAALGKMTVIYSEK